MTTGIGQILIAGLASLLICIFLGPKFIEEARQREFGQMIREEGPQAHQVKAGTPTMGGILIFVSVTVPFLILGPYDATSLAVWGTASPSIRTAPALEELEDAQDVDPIEERVRG